jgi:hypothetical protein
MLVLALASPLCYGTCQTKGLLANVQLGNGLLTTLAFDDRHRPWEVSSPQGKLDHQEVGQGERYPPVEAA